MNIVAVAQQKADYVDSVTTNSGGGEEYHTFKGPLVELYEERYAQGLDLWTGNPFADVETECDGRN